MFLQNCYILMTSYMNRILAMIYTNKDRPNKLNNGPAALISKSNYNVCKTWSDYILLAVYPNFVSGKTD